MRRHEIDGATVSEGESPGPLAGRLSFGCDPRDEDLDTIGLTHVVQQLVVRAQPSAANDNDQITGMGDTGFSGVAGSPAQVVEQVAAICTVLDNLPPADLADALADVASRDRHLWVTGRGPLNPFGSLLARRYGARGAGLLRWPEVDPRLFTAEDIRRHVRTFFTTGNAVLSLSGAAPPDLRLPLPPGPQVTRFTPSARHQAGPIWYADEVGGVQLAFLGGPDPATELLLRILTSRVNEALGRAGYAHTAQSEVLEHDADVHEHGLGFPTSPRDTTGSDTAGAAEVLWAEFQRLVVEGPAQAEIDEPVALWAEFYRLVAEGSTQEAFDEAIVAAGIPPFSILGSPDEWELLGTPGFIPSPDPMDRLLRFTAAQARDVMAGWFSSAMMVVPHGTRPALPGAVEQTCPRSSGRPSGQVYRPSMLKRLRSKGALIICSDSAAIVDGDGNVHTVPLADALLIEQGGRHLLAHTGHGCVTDISDYSAGVARLRSVLPPRRVRQGR
ncbi:hypothetical protein [Melissospora conviva]|uniref:hypothetical protein n=1 Tax=Melissospora conviva TaxID=3388432 RepID=UPI003C2133E2